MTDATASLTISLVMVGRELDALVPLLVEGMTGEKADVEAPLLVDGPAKKMNYISLKIQYSQAFMANPTWEISTSSDASNYVVEKIIVCMEKRSFFILSPIM